MKHADNWNIAYIDNLLNDRDQTLDSLLLLAV